MTDEEQMEDQYLTKTHGEIDLEKDKKVDPTIKVPLN